MLKIVNRPVRRQWKSPVKQWFRHHSRLFGFAEYSTALIKVKRKERKLEKARAKTSKGPSQPQRGPAGVMEFSFFDLYIEPSPEMDRAWEAVAALVGRIREQTEQGGGRMLVVFTASKDAMDREKFAKRFSSGDDLGMDWDRPAARLAEISAAQGVEFIDLHPVFRENPVPMSLFLKKNGHWSAAGHELAAQIVAEKINSLEGEKSR